MSPALVSPRFSRGGTSQAPALSHHSLPPSGLKRLHALTTQAAYELHVDLEDFDNGTAYARYGSFGVGLFSVDPEEDGYPLTVAGYSGTAGEARAAAGRGTRSCRSHPLHSGAGVKPRDSTSRPGS